jgi:hypothetical protein
MFVTPHKAYLVQPPFRGRPRHTAWGGRNGRMLCTTWTHPPVCWMLTCPPVGVSLARGCNGSTYSSGTAPLRFPGDFISSPNLCRRGERVYILLPKAFRRVPETFRYTCRYSPDYFYTSLTHPHSLHDQIVSPPQRVFLCHASGATESPDLSFMTRYVFFSRYQPRGITPRLDGY